MNFNEQQYQQKTRILSLIPKGAESIIACHRPVCDSDSSDDSSDEEILAE